MAKLHVQPRNTPAERSLDEVVVEVDDRLADFASAIEEWAAPRQNWEFTLHEGHDFDKANNVEGYLLFVEREQTSSARFRLDQIDSLDEFDYVLVLRFDVTDDGLAKAISCTANGLDIEMFHILLYT
ncbi:MAG: hypothetical protein ACJ76I_02570 [Gaiellaceae bacterium]